MKLRTSLQLSAVFPLVFAIVMTLSVRWWLSSDHRSEWMDTFFLAITGVVGLVMAGVILAYSGSILRKINVLNEWTNSVLKGNLQPDVELQPSDDEVGRLSEALGTMLRELKTAYAAVNRESEAHKAKHEWEKRRADAAQIVTKGLSDAISRYRTTQQELVHKERLHVLETVLKGVVHDFGEALSPIQAATDILAAHPDKLNDSVESRRLLATVSAAVATAKRLLKNLTGIFQVYRERLGPADLNVVAQRAVSMLEPRWRAEANLTGKIIDVRSGFQPVPTVVGDEADLQDAVTYLVINAVEAMPDGGVITLSTYRDKSHVVLEVRDTGTGMNPEVLSRCTEPFFTTKGDSGTGMGLTIARSVVRRCNGSLGIESEPGAGTRITLKLPVWAETVRSKADIAAPSSPSRALSILIVDDNQTSRTAAAECMSAMGHAVVGASSGPEGLQLMKTQRFDVIIVDRAMPGMAGDELARIIKDCAPSIPVMMLTGYADIMHEEGSVPPHVDLVLAKPATLRELESALAKLMSARPNRPAHTGG